MRHVGTIAMGRVACLTLGALVIVAVLASSARQTDMGWSDPASAAAASDNVTAGLDPAGLWGGSTNRVAADGAVGYVARQTAVDVVDLAANPPRSIGRRLFADRVTAVAAAPGRLYVATGSRLIVFDASRPARLSELGRWTLPADAAGVERYVGWMAVRGRTVLLSATPARSPYKGYALVAVDATDPQQLRSVAEQAVDAEDMPAGLWIAGDRLAVVSQRYGDDEPSTSHVAIFAVGDPTAIRLVGRGGPYNDYVAASLRGNLLHVAVTFSWVMRERSAEASAGIRVFDIAAPEAPRLVGRWDSEVRVEGMTRISDHAVVSLPGWRPGDGLRCIEVRIAEVQPTEVGPRACADTPAGGYPLASIESAGRLLTATQERGWEVWDWPVGDPVLRARSDDGQFVWDVATDGQRLLVFDDHTVRLVRRDGGGRPVESVLPIEDNRSFPRMIDGTGAMALSGDRAIVAGMEGMVVFDVATSPPRRLGQLAWGLPQMPAQPLVAALVGQFAVVDLYVPGHGIALIDLSDPAHPVRRSTPWDDLPVWDMTVDAGRLYVAAGSRLYVFAPGGPDGLTLLGEMHNEMANGDERDVMAVAARGDRVVIGGIWFAAVLDVQDPANIRKLAEREMDVDVSDLAFTGQDVVAAGSQNGRLGWAGRLMLLRGDTADVVAAVPTWNNVEGLAAIGDLVFAAEADIGLRAFRPWRMPDGWRGVYRVVLPWVVP